MGFQQLCNRKPLVGSASIHKGTSALQECKPLANAAAHSKMLKQDGAAKAQCLQVLVSR